MTSSSEAPGAFAFEQLPPPPAPRLPAFAPGPAGAAAAAESVLAEAERDAAQIRAAAREQGYQEGLEAARAELEPALAALAQALDETTRERVRVADAVEREAVQLALQLAEKVLASALEVRPELLLEIVEGTLRRVVERERVTVVVHPDDLELVRGAVESLGGSLGSFDRLEVQGERRVSRGGCIVRTPAGEVDARVDAQLERAAEVLAAELRG